MNKTKLLIPLLFSVLLMNCAEVNVNSGGKSTSVGGPACPPWVPWYVCNPGGGGGGARPPLGGDVTDVKGSPPDQIVVVTDGLGGVWYIPSPPVALENFPATGPVAGDSVELSFGGTGKITKK